MQSRFYFCLNQLKSGTRGETRTLTPEGTGT